MVKYTRISSVSKKRAKEKLTYKKLFEEMDAEAKATGQYVCFFCGEPIKGVANHHHLKGRENSMLNKTEYLVLAHNECHVFKYHMMSVEQLKKETWFNSFMSRLKEKDYESWQKELKKQEKAGILFGDVD